ncbi:hypothetical protein [Serratia symbiotica]
MAARGAEWAIVLYNCQPGRSSQYAAMCFRAGAPPW